MRKIILLASALAMGATMPSLAAAQGKSKGNAAKAQQSKPIKAQARGNVRGKSAVRTRAGSVRSDHWIQMSDGRWVRAENRYGANACPPGLIRKNNGCLPPGQARKLYTQGQRLPAGFNLYTDYSRIPEQYRSRVPFDARYRYIYRDDTVYVVDPTTRVVTSIIDLLL
jgi:hypothetical protein